MLSDQEQRAWEDVQRYWSRTAVEPLAVRRAAARMRTRARRERGDEPGWVAGGLWIAIFLVLFGAVPAGLALGAVTGLAWTAWRRWPEPAPDRLPELPLAGDRGRARRPPAT